MRRRDGIYGMNELSKKVMLAAFLQLAVAASGHAMHPGNQITLLFRRFQREPGCANCTRCFSGKCNARNETKNGMLCGGNATAICEELNLKDSIRTFLLCGHASIFLASPSSNILQSRPAILIERVRCQFAAPVPVWKLQGLKNEVLCHSSVKMLQLLGREYPRPHPSSANGEY